MRKILIRSCSWLSLGVLIVGTWLGWRLLPGASGLSGELEWLMNRERNVSAAFRRANEVLMAVGRRDPDHRAQAFRELLRDRDPEVVQGGLDLLADTLALAGRSERSQAGAGLNAVLVNWLEDAEFGAKAANHDTVLRCIRGAKILSWRHHPFVEVWDWSPTAEDWRWGLLGALQLPDSLDPEPYGPLITDPDVIDRLRLLDLGVDSLRALDRPFKPLHWLPAVGLPSRAQLLRLKDDPRAEVRYAAGRVLVTLGDSRGLPAFLESLGTHPVDDDVAVLLLTDLFGTEWSRYVARGSPAGAEGGRAGRE